MMMNPDSKVISRVAREEKEKAVEQKEDVSVTDSPKEDEKSDDSLQQEVAEKDREVAEE